MIEAKITSVNIGKFDVDSISIDVNGNRTEICFDKKQNISQFIGKDVVVKTENGVYTISEPPAFQENFKKK